MRRTLILALLVTIHKTDVVYPKLQTFNLTESHKSCITRLINALFQEDETINYIFENQEDTNFVPGNIKNPFMVNVLKKPTKLILRSYYNYVIHTGGLDNLNSTLRKLKISNVWNDKRSPRGNYIVVSLSRHFKQIFELAFSYDLFNVILVNYENLIEPPKLYTYKSSNCKRDIEIEFVQSCNNNLKVSYNSETANLKGCNVTVVERYQISKDLKVSGISVGSSINFIDVVGEALKLNVSFAVVENVEELINDKRPGITVSISLLRLMEVHYNFDSSDLILIDGAVWIVPKAHPIPKIKLIATVFEGTLWASILIIIVLLCLVWRIILCFIKEAQYFRDFTSYTLIIFELTINNSITRFPLSKSLRTLIFIYIFYILQITTLFKAKLIDALINPRYESPITTLEELAKSPYKAYIVNASFVEYPKVLNDIYVYVQYLNLTSLFMDIAFYGNCTAVTDYSNMKIFPALYKRVDTIYQDFPRAEVTITMRKGHYFLKPFNRAAIRIIESGFIQKIISNATVQQFVNDEEEKAVLTLSHLSGIFICWVSGLVFAFTLFVIEILIKRFKN